MSHEPRSPLLILTCEHASNHVPARYQPCFAGARRVLHSHRGHDLGAREIALGMRRLLGAALLVGRNSRLLVDLNRSPGHPALFSRWTRSLEEAERRRILERYYVPHRSAVLRAARRGLAGGGSVVHVAVHSFVPVLDGVRRQAEVGLLYDPRRLLERSLCRTWQSLLRAAQPRWRVRCNYPYRGVSDGLATALRTALGSPRYAGLELEINQSLLHAHPPRELARTFAATLEQAAQRDGARPAE